MRIVIGDKQWSSWSLRPWLALRRTGAAFEEIPVALRQGAPWAMASPPQNRKRLEATLQNRSDGHATNVQTGRS